MMFRCCKPYVESVLMMIIGFTFNVKEDESANSPIYMQYVAEITSAFVKEMHKGYGLECGASGGRMRLVRLRLILYQVRLKTFNGLEAGSNSIHFQ